LERDFNSSEGDKPIYNVDGQQLAIPLKPSEKRNELTSYFYHVVGRIGLTPGSIAQMESLEGVVREWERSNIGGESGGALAIQSSQRTVGAARTVRIKTGSQKQQHGGKKTKTTYKCSVCHKAGHTKSKCPNKKRLRDDPQSE
jgi:hypothetical protein